MPQNPTRYHSLAITLHWVMAAAVFFMLGSGLWLEYGPELAQAQKFTLIQLHKSFGVCLLIAFFLRVAVRLWQKPPALPASFPRLEKIAAALGHGLLYLLLFLLPMSGWAMVSASPYGLPTYVFGLFEWPHLPGIAGNEEARSTARQAHTILAFTLLGALAAHIGAVIKHALIDRHNLLRRMWWTKQG